MRASGRHGSVILIPDTVVEHYYHFIFDLALPLYLVLRAAPEGAPFIVDTTGPFLPRLELMFPKRVSIVKGNEDAGIAGRRVLLGMNPFLVDVVPDDARAFSEHVRSAIGIDASRPPRKVLLIERLPPQEFFTKAAKSKGGGASRRHIPNHEELVVAVRSLVRPPFEFHNIQLEHLPFDQQVRLFADAALVIGQHGAGLANCIWMSPRSRVVELTHRTDLDNFHRLSALMEHAHIFHQTSGAHVAVDSAELVARLQREPALADLFGGS